MAAQNPPSNDSSHQAEFANAIRRAGLILDGEPVMDGQLHRVPVVDGKARAKDGTYVGFTDGRPAGFIQNFRTGTRETWTSEGKELTAAEREHMAAHAQLAKLQRASELSAQHSTAAERVQAKWDRLSDAPPREENAYLARKGVEAFGVKFNGEKLVVPARDGDGKLWSLQNISAEEGGEKLFEKGGRKTGNYHLIGEPKPGEPILIAEGYATGASLHQASHRPVVVAFDAGNIESVVSGLKKRYPDNPMFVMGDDDHRQKVNVGVEKAMAVAKKHQIGVAFPSFEVKHGLSDYNDLHATQGLDAVKAQVEATLSMTMAQSREAARSFLVPAQAPTPVPEASLREQGPSAVPTPVAIPIERSTPEPHVQTVALERPASAPQPGQPVTEATSAQAPVAKLAELPVHATEPATLAGAPEAARTTPAIGPSGAQEIVAPLESSPGVVPSLPAEAATGAVRPETLTREVARPEIDGGALLASISLRNADAMAAPRNSVPSDVAAAWVAQDVADLSQVKADAQRLDALYKVGQNAQEQTTYQAELTRKAPDVAHAAATSYMEISGHLIAAQREVGRPGWLQDLELTSLADRHAEVKRDGRSLDQLPAERVDALAREDVLSLQRLRGDGKDAQTYAIISEALQSERYRETFSRETVRLPNSLSAIDGDAYAAGEKRRFDVNASDVGHRKEVERRSHDLQGIPEAGLSPTVARDIAKLDLQALRVTEHPFERLMIAEAMATNVARQPTYKTELGRQDSEIGQVVDQFAKVGRTPYDLLQSDRPHVTGVRPADATSPDDWTLPLMIRGTFHSEKTGNLTPVGVTAEAYVQTLSRADRPVWDNKQFTIASDTGLVGDFNATYKDPAVALARARGMLLEDDPIGRYLRIQPPAPDRLEQPERNAAPALTANAIEPRSRDQEFDDAATVALRQRIARANAVELNDPARLASGERTLETISRMTRKELEAFEQAVKRSPDQVEAVLARAQKRIDGDVDLRVGREPVPPLNERYNIVSHLTSRDYLFRDKPGTAFTEGWLKLRTSHESADVIKGMLDRADQRGWPVLHFAGSAEFKRQAWIGATARGMKGVGHTPTEGDRAAAEVERQRLGRGQSVDQPIGGTITRGQTDARAEGRPGQSATQDRPDTLQRNPAKTQATGSAAPVQSEGGAAPAPRSADREPPVAQQMRAYLAGVGDSPANVDAVAAIAAAKMPNDRVYVGLVTARDYAPYEFKGNAKESPYVKLKGPDGEKTIWGVDLPRALDDAGVKLGDSIALEFRGMKAVTLPVKDVDKAGQVVGWHDETVNRNTWFAARVDDLRAEAMKPAPLPTPASTPVVPTMAGAAAPLDDLKVERKPPDRLASQPVAPAAVPSLPVIGTMPSQPPAHAPTGDGGLDGISVSGPKQAQARERSTSRADVQPGPAGNHAEGPAFAAFDAALAKRNVPSALHAPLRELFGRELSARLEQGQGVTVKVFDPAASRETPRVMPSAAIASPSQKRDEHKITR